MIDHAAANDGHILKKQAAQLFAQLPFEREEAVAVMTIMQQWMATPVDAEQLASNVLKLVGG